MKKAAKKLDRVEQRKILCFVSLHENICYGLHWKHLVSSNHIKTKTTVHDILAVMASGISEDYD